MKCEKLCAICGEPSKYCCPACSIRTCSLACVNVHKKEKDCSGIRNETAYVKAKDFSNTNLLNDYRFLEEAARTIDKAGRTVPKYRQFRSLPVHMLKLRKASLARKIKLQFLPAMFIKRRTNTSYLKYVEQIIYWKVEWQFLQTGLTCIDERVNETATVNSCLDKYLSVERSNIEFQKELSYYQSYGHAGVVVLMQKATCPANDIRYYELNKARSLKDNFKGKVIIENPTFIVVGKEHIYSFPLVSDDTEESNSTVDEKTDEKEDVNVSTEIFSGPETS